MKYTERKYLAGQSKHNYKFEVILHPFVKKKIFLLQVQCDLPTGVTHIGESIEVIVDNCSEPHCFQFDVPYTASDLSQIKDIIERSAECSQTIHVDCLSAPMKVRFICEIVF